MAGYGDIHALQLSHPVSDIWIRRFDLLISTSGNSAYTSCQELCKALSLVISGEVIIGESSPNMVEVDILSEELIKQKKELYQCLSQHQSSLWSNNYGKNKEEKTRKIVTRKIVLARLYYISVLYLFNHHIYVAFIS